MKIISKFFLRSYLNKSRVKTMRLLNHHWKIILRWTLKTVSNRWSSNSKLIIFLLKNFCWREIFFPFRILKFEWMNLKGRMSRLRKATKSAWMIERSRIREENFKIWSKFTWSKFTWSKLTWSNYLIELFSWKDWSSLTVYNSLIQYNFLIL